MLSFSRTPVLRNAQVNLNKTLSLPKSSFPARATAQELVTYRQRCADELYVWQRQHRPDRVQDQFVLHDGPPYANGAVHVGHALNKILKDMILRWELAQGKRVQYRPGWDCHGLPIELKALQEAQATSSQASALTDSPVAETHAAWDSRQLSAPEIRRRARNLARKTVEKQKTSFRAWGVMGEWDRPYRTMDQDFEIRQLNVFREMVRNGLISRHHRPVYWSPSSRTALAEAELEYDDAHKCTAAFVKFPFVQLPVALSSNPNIKPDGVGILIWTTTPWTLPSNKAVAVKDDIEYTVVELLDHGGQSIHGQLVIAKDRVEHVLQHVPAAKKVRAVLDTVRGKELSTGGASCFNMFHETSSPIVCADFVTATSGTGLVHMAPGHGMEDYSVCQKHGIGPALAPVDHEGKFTHEVASSGPFSHLQGLDAQTDGVRAVLAALEKSSLHVAASVWSEPSSLLLASHEFVHKSPIDWRTKMPVIVRATAQWFADVSMIKDRALRSLDSVSFIPETGRSRLMAFIGGRSQWCISRQRAWGVPIPALYHKHTGDACITPESIDHIVSTLKTRGTDAWYSDAADESAWVHPSLAKDEWVRGQDTMDVWFDSGSSWTSLDPREGKAVSDVYLEGTDQHRGWFQSSLLTHVAIQEGSAAPLAPYSNLITHGFTLDADGRKMSKSLGNVIAPEEIISGSLLPPIKARKQRGKKDSQPSNAPTPQFDSMGPDMLRLWVASSDYTRDVVVAVPVLQEIQQALQKYRVTFKFLLGVLADYPSHVPDETFLHARLSFADVAILQRLSACSRVVRDAYRDYQFHRAIKEVNHLINTDLSAFYIEICKDRLYTDTKAVRQHTQTVLLVVMRELLQMLSPAVPHLVEEVWEHTPLALRDTHPLQKVWDAPFAPSFANFPATDKVATMLVQLEALSDATKLAQETARRAGHLKSGLASKVVVQLQSSRDDPANTAAAAFAAQVSQWAEQNELAELLIVSAAVLKPFAESSEHGASPGVDSSSSDWSYAQPVQLDGETVGLVTVHPPDMHKCPRCWRHVATDAETPCARCQTVLAEQQAQR